MIRRILFWLNNSRLFSYPMTFMSWLVVFLYALQQGGNWVLGVIALLGVSFAHLATNLVDDYVDYKTLVASECGFEGAPASKCAYIRNGDASIQELLGAIIAYLAIASVSGLVLTYYCGWMIPVLALIGSIFVLFYAKFSCSGLSEFAVGVAFGPLLFEGIYYVMCGKFSLPVLILSIAVGIFTVVLVSVNALLDFDGDMANGKKTLCCRFGNKFKALKFIAGMLVLGYLSVLLLVYLTGNYWFFLTYLTIPYAIQAYGAMYSYNVDKNSIPKLSVLNFPIEKTEIPYFHYRLFLTRNLMMYFSLLTVISIVL